MSRTILKTFFKDIIQELMEAELEEKLGYAKEERSAKKYRQL